MSTTLFMFECPNCHLPVKAEMDESPYHFLMYKCPKCNCNVTHFENKTVLISNTLFNKVLKHRKIKTCGHVSYIPQPRITKSGEFITDDDLLNLKIVLETSGDSWDIINKI